LEGSVTGLETNLTACVWDDGITSRHTRSQNNYPTLYHKRETTEEMPPADAITSMQTTTSKKSKQ
jgi:hypothetical protein